MKLFNKTDSELSKKYQGRNTDIINEDSNEIGHTTGSAGDEAVSLP